MNLHGSRSPAGGTASSSGRRARGPLWLAIWFCALVAAGVVGDRLRRPVAGLDRRLVDDLVSVRAAAYTVAAHALSYLGRSWVLVPLAGLVGLALWRRCGPRATSVTVAVVGAVVLQNVVKAIVRRPRPPVLHLEHVTGTSFPSGHATESSAFLLALVVAVWPLLRTRRERAGAATVAGLLALGVATSRVYLGVHYPTDVAAGILIGGSWAAATMVVWFPTPPPGRSAHSVTGRRPARRHA